MYIESVGPLSLSVVFLDVLNALGTRPVARSHCSRWKDDPLFVQREISRIRCVTDCAAEIKAFIHQVSGCVLDQAAWRLLMSLMLLANQTFWSLYGHVEFGQRDGVRWRMGSGLTFVFAILFVKCSRTCVSKKVDPTASHLHIFWLF